MSETTDRPRTPLPWETVPCGRPDCWCACVQSVGNKDDSMEGCVAASGCLVAADAAFIVRACNAFDDLLAACRCTLEMLGDDAHAYRAGELAREAIAKAEGKAGA